jgi:hypothetical protein
VATYIREEDWTKAMATAHNGWVVVVVDISL